MQAAAPINVAPMPQAGPVETSTRPAVSDRSKTRFMEYLQRSFEQPTKDAGPARGVNQTDIERISDEDMPDEEIVAETCGFVQFLSAQGGEPVAAAIPQSEEVAPVEGPSDFVWTVPPEVSGSDGAADVHVTMVQEKITEILEADRAYLAESDGADLIQAAADGSGTDEPVDAPTIENAHSPFGEMSVAAPQTTSETDGANTSLTGGFEQGTEETPLGDDMKNARVPAGAAAPQTAPATWSGTPIVETRIRAEAAERALMRFSQDLLQLRTGVSEIRITLEPESLGELTISVMKTDGGVSARIFSPDRDVCSAVADKLPILMQAIEKNGLTMQDLEIIHTPAGFNNQNAPQPGNSGRQGGRRGQSFRAFATLSGDDESTFWSDFHQNGRPEDATVVYRV
ncbi:MAG TPA: flagellar hook-length control protein FliK [Papillibacter sp.]|jgi:hypothetical protein|nr:flagellar hook-length control protein FliK [Papillibacter sp.]